jgi:hypothetical protein
VLIEGIGFEYKSRSSLDISRAEFYIRSSDFQGSSS